MAVAVVRGGHDELQDAGEAPAPQKVGSECVGVRGPRLHAKHLLPKRERERERERERVKEGRVGGGGHTSAWEVDGGGGGGNGKKRK